MGLPVNFLTLLQIDASNKTSTYTAEATTLFDGDPQGTAGFLAMYLYLDSARTAPLRTVRTITLDCTAALPSQPRNKSLLPRGVPVTRLLGSGLGWALAGRWSLSLCCQKLSFRLTQPKPTSQK